MNSYDSLLLQICFAQTKLLKLISMLTQASAAILCDCCESQPATIQCYTCLMYLCAVGCHHSLRCHSRSYTGTHHRYMIVSDTKKLGYVNMMPSDPHTFEERRSVIRNALHTISLVSADKIKVQSRILRSSVLNLIPELVNIVNEYVASKATVELQLDCLDYNQKWYVGEIVEIVNEEAFIRFHGCSSMWNEWIHLKSKRFAPLHSYTNIHF